MTNQQQEEDQGAVMPHDDATSPHAVIESAIWNWWTTTDPLADFNPADVADQIHDHLRASGYTITANPRTS